MREVIRTSASTATSISTDELQAVVGDLVDVGKHVADGELPQGDLSANAVALWAMQQAYSAIGLELLDERRDLNPMGYDVALTYDAKWAVRDFFYDHLAIRVHNGCIYPGDAPWPQWVKEWRSGARRWWHHPRLAAELVAYAPKMKAGLDDCIEGVGYPDKRPMPPESKSRERGPVERRARALVHLYLVDVVALIASRLPSTKAAAV